MTTLQDIIDYVEQLAGHPLREDEGPRFGDTRATVTGVTVCWMVTPQAISAAAERGHNLIICHEALTYPYPGIREMRERPYLAWPTNAQRLCLLAKHQMVVCRMHGTLDELFVYKAFCNQIGATDTLAEIPGHALAKIFRLQAIRYAELIERVKAATGLAAVRATCGRPDRQINTAGVAVGGMALFTNVEHLQALIELGPIDAVICGETDNYGMRFCQELGIDVIETSHEISEDPGLRLFAEDLSRRFSALPVAFVPTEVIWRVY